MGKTGVRGTFAALVAAVLCGCGSEPDFVTVDGTMLGTTLHVVADVKGVSRQRLYAAVMELDREAKASMSIYDSTSLVSRLNRNETDSVDRHIAFNLHLADSIGALSDGRYDVTVKPLVEAWGFAGRERVENPNVDSILEFVGREKVRVEGGRLVKDDPRVQLDFNSAASTLVEHAEEQGAIWYWEHTGVVLVTETKNITVQQETADETGAVTMADVEIPQTTVSGVIAKDKDGKYHKFLGKKGVVLACGGYGGNHEMYVALQDEQRELYKSHGLDTSDLKCSGFGRDGSGIKMGMWAGASMDPCARTLVSPQVRYNSEHYATNILRWGGSFTEGENPWGCPFVWLDESGRRFTDETFLGVFGQLMRAERMKPGRYYAIFDSQYADLISKMPPEHFGMPVGHSDSFDFDGVFKSWLDRGAEGAEVQEGETVCAWAANTLEELFQYMGLTETQQAAFKAEIEKYNTYCANGDDEDFGRDPKMLLSVTKPPFYGMYSAEEKPMVGTVTLNGLVIDEDQKVLDANYNPIVGLYATGNNSGGRFAVQYSTPMPGLTLGMAMTLGRVLGKGLAEA